MGSVTAVTGVGQLLTATFSGAVVDRVNRRRLMIGCDCARLLLYALLPTAALLGHSSLALIWFVAATTAVASNLFSVAYMAAVANLVEADDVPPANSRLQASQALTFVIGSALAGAVCAGVGPSWAMGIDAVSFAASAVSLAQIVFRRDTAVSDAVEGESSLAQLLKGLKFLLGHRVLRSLVAVQTCIALLGSIGLGAAVIDLIVFRLKVDFNENSTIVGACLAMAAVGAVLGALSASRLRQRMSLGSLALFGTGLQGLGLVCGGLSPNLWLLMLAGVLWSGGLTSRAVAATSLRQMLTPDALLGRVVAAGWTMIFSAGALGAVLVTHAAARYGAAPALLGLGIGLVLITAVGKLTPLGKT